MQRFSTNRYWILAVVSILLGATAGQAGTLTPNPPNGNPHSVGPLNNYTVTLTPDPASYRSPAIGCTWLLPAAQAAVQPYNNATNVWNFSYAANFSGTFNMTQYAATNDGSFGGANFNITYTPGAGDPTGNAVRWMQVIDTNMPSARGTTYGVAGNNTNGVATGTTAYLDNAGPGNGQNGTGAPIDPYYGWLTATNVADITTSTAANSTHFFDAPSLPLADGRDWEAQAFVTSEADVVNGAVTTHNVTIYGGVWWGFKDNLVPEPAALTLLAVCAIALRRNKRAMR